MNILSQNYVFVKTIILSTTCPKAYHRESKAVIFAMQFILLCKLYFDFVKVIFRLAAEVKVNPQRARGIHRAEGATLLPTGKNIASSLL